MNSSYVLSNAIDVDASLTFNLYMDIQTNMFVAMEIHNDDRAKGIPFFLAKVIIVSRQAYICEIIFVLWYQPKMLIGL